MKNKTTHIVARPLIGTALLLMVPFILMQFHVPVYDPGSGYEQVGWSAFDFILMGIMLFIAGLGMEFAMRKMGKYRVAAAVAVVVVFLYIWAELAVGIFNIPGISGS